MRDFRFALRVLWRNRGFAAAAILALALGIGANTAIFAIVYAVLWKPLPYHDPAKLVVALHDGKYPVSPADYLDYRAEVHAFTDIAAAQAWGGALAGPEKSEIIPGLQVTANMMQLLGVQPALGRAFLPEEDGPAARRVLLLSDGLWRKSFGADPHLVGRSVRISDLDYTVIGIMPAGFQFAPFWQTQAEMWTPLVLAPRANNRGGRSLRVFARLRPGVDLNQAQAQMDIVARRLGEAFPKTNARLGISVVPLHEKVVGAIRPTLVALFATVGFVLLIACADVINLLLTRAISRGKEIAVRLAMGAGRWQIVRQLGAESVILAALGGAAGLALARICLGALSAALPEASLPRQHEVALGSAVLAFTVILSAIAGVASGLVPALFASRCDLNEALKQGGRSSTEGHGRRRTQSVLIVAQVSMALALLVLAVLMMRTLGKLNGVEAGFNPKRLLTLQVYAPKGAYNTGVKRAALYQRVEENLAAVSGIRSVSAINHLPIGGDIWSYGYEVVGRPAPPPGQGFGAVYRVVLPRYFSTMQIPFVSGRDFTERDNEHAPSMVIINQAMARHRWPAEDPIGKQIRLGEPNASPSLLTIAGVVKNARQSDWTGEPDDEIYLPYLQRTGAFGLTDLTFVARTGLDPDAVIGAAERAVLSIDRTIPLSHVRPMERVIANQLWRSRVTAILLMVFAGIALVLTAVGIYGVIAYAVRQRTQEIGIRMALGATRPRVMRLLLAQSLRPVGAGLVVGAVLALAAGRFVSSLLYGVRATDPAAFVVVTICLVTTGVLATGIPVWRALRKDPVRALRHES